MQKNELEKRLDPFYYVPELLELEKKVLTKEPKKLRDYVVGISSGATPKTTESEKYYAEKENGIPFLRVQNLSPTGILEFDDCKYINEETHNGMLKRSQVKEGDLLVKITGVGRMAVASVAPEGFEGNINQHVCVIRTGNKEISKTLAAFLNTDIGEKLASRRATGGTRPALDYPSLLSIPIIEDKRILEITSKVVEQKKQKEAEANKLLSTIDEYLLNELGIKLPEPPENTLKNRMFTTNINTVTGGRLDPFFHQKHFEALKNPSSKYSTKRIKEINEEIKTGLPVRKDYRIYDGAYPYYGANGIIGFMDEYTHDGLYLVIGQDGYIGNHYVVEGKFWGSNHNWVLKLKSGYDYHYVKSALDVLKYDYLITGGVIPKLTKEALESIRIPVPPLDKQKKIAEHITGIRQQAQQMKDKTNEALKKASEEIEKILLN
ncbi:MAG: restriction endonuclease subunit S [Paludibacter sp.]|nr:restriction endonuclease subunit S [Paludibacter sp.]